MLRIKLAIRTGSHNSFNTMDYKKDTGRRLQQIISLPIILSVFIPMVIFDIWIELYHRTCFRLYGIAYVKRCEYVKIDRHRLGYLNWYEKIGCAYCGYANGLVQYWTVIAAKTEQYWCGIMHKKYSGFKAPDHHKNFTKYGDEKEFIKRYK